MQERLMLCTWKAAAFAALSLLAVGCQTPQTATTGPSSERIMAQADRLSRDKQYAAAAQAYEELAATQTGELRSRVLLRAARDWLRVPEVAKAQALLPQIIDQSLPGPDRVLRQLVGARIALLQRQPERALADLDRIPAPYPRDQAVEILELRTLALFDYGRPAGAVITAIDREQMLSDAVEVERNRRMIWDGIERSAAAVSTCKRRPVPIELCLDGWSWVTCVGAGAQSFSVQPALTEWLNKYRDHPAHSLITRNVLPQLNAAMVYPDQVALLLPLSGPSKPMALPCATAFLPQRCNSRAINVRACASTTRRPMSPPRINKLLPKARSL